MIRSERRRARRVTPESSSPLSRVRLRTGHELRVLDIGSVGAKVDGASRLLPNRHVDLRLTTPRGNVLVRALVIRSRVVDLAGDVVTYESALSFERPVLLVPQESP